jgi:hypothetical protein
METRDFCYWLQGFFELDGHSGLSKDQVQKIRTKLDSCFVHEAMGEDSSENPLTPTQRLASRKRRC